VLSGLVSTSKPGEKTTYDELVVTLTEHHAQSCTVQDSAAVQVQFAVPTCKRVSCYLCSEVLLDNYGMSLDEMLRDRIVCGIAKR